MRPFKERIVCYSRVHCEACRARKPFMVEMGAPEECYYGPGETPTPPVKPDTCPHATRACCGSAPACAITGENCPGLAACPNTDSLDRKDSQCP